MSGKAAHGGVALLWKISLDNYVSPLEDIYSDRIVGIQCNFPEYDTLYILGVYLLSSSLNTEVYDEYFDYMWALHESLSLRGMELIMGDFNGDLGNSRGDNSGMTFIHNHPPRAPPGFAQTFAPTLGLLHPSFCPGGGHLLG